MQIVDKKTAPLEQKQRLSNSVIWKLQRSFYTDHGIDAWRRIGVPSHATSNSYIARAYARVVSGFLADWRAALDGEDDSPAGRPDPSQPFYIVELGSGHGRLAYLLLKRLEEIRRRSGPGDLRVKYVMTDFAERNLEYWRGHARLQPFIEEGVLDMARFDIGSDRELKLVCSGETLSAETVRNPVAVIANYVFDSVPQDAFFMHEGKLYETLLTVSTREKSLDLNDPEALSRVELSFSNNPAEEDYYDDAEWNLILRDCRQRLPTTAFLFPLAALRCVRNLHALSGGRLLLLSADKGYNQDEALLMGQGIPGIAGHGKSCFSMMVDYQIIGKYFQLHGGQALHPRHTHRSINISAFLLGDPPGGFAAMRRAYGEFVEEFGPDDFTTLAGGISHFQERLSFEQSLAYLRLSAWDYWVLWSCLPVFKGCLENLSEGDKQELYEAVQNVWAAYFPIGEDDDLAFNLGVLLLEMQFYSEALEFFQHSAALYGMEPGTAYNMGVCYYKLRQMGEALQQINRALELNPEFDAARALSITIQSALNR